MLRLMAHKILHLFQPDFQCFQPPIFLQKSSKILKFFRILCVFSLGMFLTIITFFKVFDAILPIIKRFQKIL